MSAFRTNSTIARTVLSAVTRRTLIRPSVFAPVARSFSILAKADVNPVTNRNLLKEQKQGFATSLADFSMKSDDALDKAQQYIDEGVSFQANDMLPLAMSSFQKSINERPTGKIYPFSFLGVDLAADPTLHDQTRFSTLPFVPGRKSTFIRSKRLLQKKKNMHPN